MIPGEHLYRLLLGADGVSTCILPGRIRFLARMMTLAEKLAPEMIRGSSNRPMEEFLILLLQALGEFLLELFAWLALG